MGSLLQRILETAVAPTYKELGIAVVAYSPLARNLLTNTAEMPKKGDFRAGVPRYSAENFAKNQELISKIATLGERKGKTVAQLSLAWLYHRAKVLGLTVVPIPGTTNANRAAENLAALQVTL